MSADTSSSHYIKTWAILLVLLIISIIGPEFGIRSVTLITAFGIAIVKAVIVAREFMHLKLEKRYITYILFVMMAANALFYAGVFPDVLEKEGRNWERTISIDQPGGPPSPAH